MDPQQRRFKYDPLPESGSFRLIKETTSDATGSHLSCVLEAFSLDDCPSYRCLSYTWGSALTNDAESGEHTDTPRSELTVRAEEAAGVLSIIENLSDALGMRTELVLVRFYAVYVDRCDLYRPRQLEREVIPGINDGCHLQWSGESRRLAW